MGKVYSNITEAVGRTPLVKLNRMVDGGATVLAKMESFNPCSSVKDRIAVSMVGAAEKAGKINDQTVLI
ncbi:MAG: pyridoxal-phosphate dependent enzyme, partial [Planctomycetota bacterium]